MDALFDLILTISSTCFEHLSYSSTGCIPVCAVFGIDHAENISNFLSHMLSKL